MEKKKNYMVPRMETERVDCEWSLLQNSPGMPAHAGRSITYEGPYGAFEEDESVAARRRWWSEDE